MHDQREWWEEGRKRRVEGGGRKGGRRERGRGEGGRRGRFLVSDR